MSRKPSKVFVEVIDFSDAINEAYSVIKGSEKYVESIAGLTHDGPWGIVRTRNGIYFFNHMGIGSPTPVINDSSGGSATIQMYMLFNDPPGFNPIPVVKYRFDVNSLLQLTTGVYVALHKFIRRAGGLVESNYKMWNDLLSPITLPVIDVDDSPLDEENTGFRYPEKQKQRQPKAAAVVKEEVKYASYEELQRYGKFLINYPCECKAPKLLCTVNTQYCQCPCGDKANNHRHCKECGGIFPKNMPQGVDKS